MKKLLIVCTLIITFTTCNQKKNINLFDYCYDFKLLNEPIIMVYKSCKSDTVKYLFYESFLKVEGLDSLLIQTSYDNSFKYDSSIVKISNYGLIMLESYYFNFDSIQKAMKLENVSGDTIPKILSKSLTSVFKLKNDFGDEFQITSINRFIKKDTISINNKSYECLVTTYDISYSFDNIVKYQAYDTTYIAENIGLVKRYSSNTKDIWILDTIISKKDFNMKDFN